MMEASSGKIVRIIVFSLLGLLFALGIAAFVLYKNFKKPQVAYAHHIITFTKDGKMEGYSTVAVKNDNPYSIRVDNLTYSMQMKGRTYFSGKKEHPLVLRSHQIDTFALPYTEASEQMDKDFAGNDSMPAEIIMEGDVSVLGLKRVHLRIPYHTTYTFFKKPELIGDKNSFNIEPGGNTEVTVLLKLVNKNKYPVEVDSFSYSLDIAGTKYIKSRRLKPFRAGALDTQQAALSFNFNYMKFMKQFKGKDSAMHHFLFDMELSAKGFHKAHVTIPLDRKLPLVTYFKVQPEHFKLKKLSAKELQLAAILKVDNPNPVSFHVAKTSYELSVDDHQWAKGDIPKPFSLPMKASNTLEIPITLSLKEMGRSAKEFIKNDQPQHYDLKVAFSLLTGDPKMKSIRMNLQDTGILHLSKLLSKKQQEKDVSH